MCQATVYLGDKEIAREITGLEMTDEGVRLTSFFDDPQVVAGRILHIDFLKHRVQLELIEEDEG